MERRPKNQVDCIRKYVNEQNGLMMNFFVVQINRCSFEGM